MNSQIIIKPSLQAIADHYLLKGFHILFKDDESIQLIKEKKFSCLLGVLLFLFLVPGLIVYFIFYLAMTDKKINIRKRSESTVSIINQKGEETVFNHMPTEKEMNRAAITKSEIFWRWFVMIWFGFAAILEIIGIVYFVNQLM